jgi:hypothetical protein
MGWHLNISNGVRGWSLVERPFVDVVDVEVRLESGEATRGWCGLIPAPFADMDFLRTNYEDARTSRGGHGVKEFVVKLPGLYLAEGMVTSHRAHRVLFAVRKEWTVVVLADSEDGTCIARTRDWWWLQRLTERKEDGR